MRQYDPVNFDRFAKFVVFIQKLRYFYFEDVCFETFYTRNYNRSLLPNII